MRPGFNLWLLLRQPRPRLGEIRSALRDRGPATKCMMCSERTSRSMAIRPASASDEPRNANGEMGAGYAAIHWLAS